MGRIVYAAAMSHVLAPDYYGKNVGPHGRAMVEELIDVVGVMGREMLAARPDALVVVADDHLNVFSFDAVPAFCVRIGRRVERMVQEDAIEFDRALDGLPERYPVHEDLANRVLEEGMEAGIDFAASWSAPLDHAFLSPVSVLCGEAPVPPLVPVWVNCFVAPQPSARRCI
jgi:aromatic ring-opening dioxygenase catalytic subunit (LigB family)